MHLQIPNFDVAPIVIRYRVTGVVVKSKVPYLGYVHRMSFSQAFSLDWHPLVEQCKTLAKTTPCAREWLNGELLDGELSRRIVISESNVLTTPTLNIDHTQFFNFLDISLS